MRILLIGGSGYVGSMLTSGLTDTHEVRILDPRPPTVAGCEYLAGSAVDPVALATALTGVAVPTSPEPVVIRGADGSQIPALVASDLTRAVLSALDHRRGFDVFHIVGDGTGRFWNLEKARDVLGWRPMRRR